MSLSIETLLQQAQLAQRQGQAAQARHAFQAALNQDPSNQTALLHLAYLARDGRASLVYLSRLLEVNPQHPQARAAVRWARRRAPNLQPRAIATSSQAQAWSLYVLVLASFILLVGLGLQWLGRSQTSEPGALETAALNASAATSRTPTPVPATPTPTPLPSFAWISVAGRAQNYKLSCESRSAADLAAYWSVTHGETQFLDSLGQSDNPHAGFVGDVNAPAGSLPPFGYGVYNEPVAAALRRFGLDAEPVYLLGLDWLRAEISADRPVIVWATYDMTLYEILLWPSADGRVSKVVPYMHTFIAHGFNSGGFYLIDAFDGCTHYYDNQIFLAAWSLLDQMAVKVNGPLETPEPDS